MGFKTKEELRDIIEGGVYSCGLHDFVCDRRDIDAVRKHEEEFDHTISGTGICQRCKKEKVAFKGLPKPPEGSEPGCFCDKCKEILKKELFPEGGSQ